MNNSTFYTLHSTLFRGVGDAAPYGEPREIPTRADSIRPYGICIVFAVNNIQVES